MTGLATTAAPAALQLAVLDPLAGALRVPVRTFTVWQVVGALSLVPLAGAAAGLHRSRRAKLKEARG